MHSVIKYSIQFEIGGTPLRASPTDIIQSFIFKPNSPTVHITHGIQRPIQDSKLVSIAYLIGAQHQAPIK